MKKEVLVIIAILALTTCLVGCGGGGKSNQIPLPPLVYGVVQIHSDTLFPMGAALKLVGDIWVNAAPGTRMSRVKGGWVDVTLGIAMPTPPERGDSEEYPAAVYNDLNEDGQYQANEFLGASEEYFKWNGSTKKWRIHNADGSVKLYDAFAQSGSENFYIQAEYLRSGYRSFIEWERSAIEAMKALQKR